MCLVNGRECLMRARPSDTRHETLVSVLYPDLAAPGRVSSHTVGGCAELGPDPAPLSLLSLSLSIK